MRTLYLTFEFANGLEKYQKNQQQTVTWIIRQPGEGTTTDDGEIG